MTVDGLALVGTADDLVTDVNVTIVLGEEVDKSRLLDKAVVDPVT